MRSNVKIIIILALSFIFVLFLAAKAAFALPPGGGDDSPDPCKTNPCLQVCAPDTDNDGVNDLCDDDDDGDGDPDQNDCKPLDPDIFHGQTEICGDNIDNNCDDVIDPKEVCEASGNTTDDRDGDGVKDDIDNCPDIYNPDQDEKACVQLDRSPLPGMIGNISSGGCGAITIKSKKETFLTTLLVSILLIGVTILRKHKDS